MPAGAGRAGTRIKRRCGVVTHSASFVVGILHYGDDYRFETVPLLWFATQTLAPSKATPYGFKPTG